MAYKLEELFDDYNIQYWNKGKNCTPGWVNIQCCFCQDRSNHLGVDKKSGKARCWKCGPQGNIYSVLQELMSVDFKEAKSIVRKYEDDLLPNIEKEVVNRPSALKLPIEAKHEFPELHKEYLIKRGFYPIALRDKYKLLACDMFGDYKFRIIIPIYQKHRLINFAAMSVLPASLKIKNCPDEKVIVPRSSLVYNYDNIQNRKAIVVEGFTDCWKMGDNCIATLGTQVTSAQIQLIAQACDKAIVMFDSEKKDKQAPIQAEKLARALYDQGCKSEVVYLPYGDPGDLSLREAAKLKADLLN